MSPQGGIVLMILWRGFCNCKLPAHLNVDESGIADLANVEEAVKTLKPVKDASVFMSEESSPTVSLIAPVYAQLLQSMSDTIGDQPLIRDVKNAITTDLFKR